MGWGSIITLISSTVVYTPTLEIGQPFSSLLADALGQGFWASLLVAELLKASKWLASQGNHLGRANHMKVSNSLLIHKPIDLPNGQ